MVARILRFSQSSAPKKSKSPRLEGETTPTRERVRSGFAGGVTEEQYRRMREQCNVRYIGASGIPVQCSEIPQFFFGFKGHLQECQRVGCVFCCDHAAAVLDACLPDLPVGWSFSAMEDVALHDRIRLPKVAKDQEREEKRRAEHAR